MPRRSRSGRFEEEITLSVQVGSVASDYELTVVFFEDEGSIEIESILYDDKVDFMWLTDDYELNQEILRQLNEDYIPEYEAA